MILTAAGTRGVARTYCEIHEFNAPARLRTTRSPTAHSSSSTRDGAHRPPVWRGPVVTRSLGSTLPISGALSPDRGRAVETDRQSSKALSRGGKAAISGPPKKAVLRWTVGPLTFSVAVRPMLLVLIL
jgi:hypothetical protein